MSTPHPFTNVIAQHNIVEIYAEEAPSPKPPYIEPGNSRGPRLVRVDPCVHRPLQEKSIHH